MAAGVCACEQCSSYRSVLHHSPASNPPLFNDSYLSLSVPCYVSLIIQPICRFICLKVLWYCSLLMGCQVNGCGGLSSFLYSCNFNHKCTPQKWFKVILFTIYSGPQACLEQISIEQGDWENHLVKRFYCLWVSRMVPAKLAFFWQQIVIPHW